LEIDDCTPFGTSLFSHHAYLKNPACSPSYIPLLPSDSLNEIKMAVVRDKAVPMALKDIQSPVFLIATIKADG